MRILVISDTHGEMGKVYEVYRSLKDIDMIVHLGDLKSDANDLEEKLGIEVAGVKGNMDGARTKEDSSMIINTEAGKILLTHGHADGVNYNLTQLYYRALEEGCVAAFFGHTHVPYLEESGEVILLNPGSLTRPRDGSDGSYSIVETGKDGIKCDIRYYRKSTKPRGGYIKGLINYSDRF